MQCVCASCGFTDQQFKALLTSVETRCRADAEQDELLRGMRVSVTIDDLFLWKGLPWADGYTPASVAAELIRAFDSARLDGVHAFSATAPAVEDPSLFGVFDDWVAAGHRIANHTHTHANLYWVSADTYMRDVERAERDIARWVRPDDGRYFRYAMDGWGNTPDKYDIVQRFLADNQYRVAPISAWFYDTEFIAPHLRYTRCGDAEALRIIRDAYVQTAITQLRHHARLARQHAGRMPPLIFLMHATPLAQDCAQRLFERLLALGVEFITLDEAMADPFNYDDPRVVTNHFYNHAQKWAAQRGEVLEDCPPAVLAPLEQLHPASGPTGSEIMTGVFRAIAESAGGHFFPKRY